jgi:hypothetical protein
VDNRKKRTIPTTLEEKARLTLFSLIVQIRSRSRDALEFAKPRHETYIVPIREAERWNQPSSNFNAQSAVDLIICRK